MVKMGIHNKITEVRYYKIKAVTKVPADDKASMENYGIGASTCRKIRNTKNYAEYVASNQKRKRHAHKDEIAKAQIDKGLVDNKLADDIIEEAKIRIILATVTLVAILAFMLFIIAITVRG